LYKICSKIYKKITDIEDSNVISKRETKVGNSQSAKLDGWMGKNSFFLFVIINENKGT
jgi:hypothetical protein